MKNIIEIKNITKKYKNFTLDNMTLDIPSGTIIGLIGENGAGKTTLIKSILNIINIDSGTIKIFNKDYKKNEDSIKDDLAVVLDDIFFPEILCPNDISIIMNDIYKNWDKELFNKYLTEFNLNKTSKIKTMSKGMRKKLEIITALSHHSKLLILDEPTSGLDPIVRNEILDIFMKFVSDDEHTILFSTHITSDLERIADKIVFIDSSKLLLNETRDEILDNYGILKCNLDDFKKIDSKDIIRYEKTRYNYNILVGDKTKLTKKYKDFIIDKITLDDLMQLMIKGVK